MDRPYDPTDRLFDPTQGGGAMLDLGVYVVSFAQYFLGRPDRVEVVGSLAPTGVDAEAALLLGYADGRAASLLISLRNPTPGAARLHGTGGWIEVPPRFHHPTGSSWAAPGTAGDHRQAAHSGPGTPTS